MHISVRGGVRACICVCGGGGGGVRLVCVWGGGREARVCGGGGGGVWGGVYMCGCM